MPLEPGDLMFVGWDADNEDIAFVTTVDLTAGEVIYFTDDEWNGTSFNGSEQLFEWTVPAGGIEAGTVVTIDMNRPPPDADFDVGGSVDYIRGGALLANGNEMFWAFQGTRVGDTVTPTDFIGVIANEADGNNNQTPNLSGTGLTTSNGAIIIDGDEDYMEFTADGTLSNPVPRDDLIAAISDLSNWTTADGGGNNNPNGTGFDVNIPDVVCFTEGSRIRTPLGLRPVETLAAGDTVLTVDHGPQVIRWVGKRRISQAELARHSHVRPVLIRKDAFGPGVPARDTHVSPQHRLHLASPEATLLFGTREVLAPAKALTNDVSILVDPAPQAVTYVHLMFDRHQLLWVDGMISESFLPGASSMLGMEPARRQGLLTVCPEFSTAAPAFQKAARRTLKPYEARLMSVASDGATTVGTAV